PFGRTVQLHPVADPVQPVMEVGGVLEAELLGRLTLEQRPAEQPEHHDREHLDPGVPLLAELDVRLLLLRGGGPVRWGRWRGPRVHAHDVCSSATTTRRMSSSSTTPTSLSPSTTRHGPWWSSTLRAASRTICSARSVGPSLGTSCPSGGRI